MLPQAGSTCTGNSRHLIICLVLERLYRPLKEEELLLGHTKDSILGEYGYTYDPKPKRHSTSLRSPNEGFACLLLVL